MASLPAQDIIAQDIYEASARHHTAENKKRRYGRGRYLGMSQLGKSCSRDLWYDFRSFTPTPFDGQVGMIFGDGNYYEDKIIEHLKLAGYRLSHTGYNDQLELSAHNGFLRGHCDGILHGIPAVSGKDHVLECKSAKGSKFKSFQQYGVRKTYPAYYSQCQCYMGYSRLERAVVIVYCKDTSAIYSERIHFKKHDFDALHERALSIITANTPPERAFSDQEVMDCRWCDFRIHCWMPEESIIMAGDKVCGSCWYHTWKDMRNCCTHPDHPFFLNVWGIGCQDYSYMWDKPVGPYKVDRKEAVDVDQVKEAE